MAIHAPHIPHSTPHSDRGFLAKFRGAYNVLSVVIRKNRAYCSVYGVQRYVVKLLFQIMHGPVFPYTERTYQNHNTHRNTKIRRPKQHSIYMHIIYPLIITICDGKKIGARTLRCASVYFISACQYTAMLLVVRGQHHITSGFDA